MTPATELLVKALNDAIKEGSGYSEALDNLRGHLFKYKGDVENRDFSNAKFFGLSLIDVNFAKCNLSNAVFEDCQISSVTFNDADLSGAKFIGTTMCSNLHVMNARFIKARFACDLQSTDFFRTVLDECDFSSSRLRNCKFRECSLAKANLCDLNWDETISFASLNSISDAKIDPYSLASLGEECGLTKANRMDLKVLSDVAKLRSEFGGIWALLHATGLVVFFIPYGKFLATQSILARFTDKHDQTISLLEAMARFIVSGGQQWKEGWSVSWLSFSSFVFYFIYNAARFLLLWKTKKLETQEEISGLPVRFSLSTAGRLNRWGYCYKLVNWLFYGAAIAVGFNTYHFLMQRVSIE